MRAQADVRPETVSPGRTSSCDGPIVRELDAHLRRLRRADARGHEHEQRRASTARKTQPGVSSRHPVDADHPAHHVILDVAVVEPRPRGVLAPAEPEGLGRADGLGVPRRRRPGVIQRWPWTWKVWKSEPIAITSHWTRSPTFAWKTGVLPTNARPSIVMNLPMRHQHDLELAVGRALVAAEDREHPGHPAVDRVHHRRRVVVVGPHAGRVLAGVQHVGVRLAGLARSRPRPENPGRRRRRSSAA